MGSKTISRYWEHYAVLYMILQIFRVYNWDLGWQ